MFSLVSNTHFHIECRSEKSLYAIHRKRIHNGTHRVMGTNENNKTSWVCLALCNRVLATAFIFIMWNCRHCMAETWCKMDRRNVKNAVGTTSAELVPSGKNRCRFAACDTFPPCFFLLFCHSLPFVAFHSPFSTQKRAEAEAASFNTHTQTTRMCLPFAHTRRDTAREEMSGAS